MLKEKKKKKEEEEEEEEEEEINKRNIPQVSVLWLSILFYSVNNSV